ncbi:helix-turn-helix domain-containing protein [Micromonosporaceae bacterium Da 78-11]
MAEDISPTVARRRLRLTLREARESAGRTQLDVAEQMEWSLSKVIRIENGDVSIAPNDLRPLLAFLNIKDRATVAELLAIAKIARARQRQAWYQRPEYRENLTPSLLRLIEYEAEAVEIRYYSVFYIPGPLQTLDYAKANLATFDDDDIPESKRRFRAEARERRRETIVSRLGELQIYILLDESVFRRPLGGPKVFVEQLRELYDLAAADQIKIRMIAFTFDSAITNNATFDLLSLSAEAEGNEVLYRETGLTDEILEDAATTGRHHSRFDKIWRVAAPEEDTIDFLSSRIKDLEAQIRDQGNNPQ